MSLLSEVTRISNSPTYGVCKILIQSMWVNYVKSPVLAPYSPSGLEIEALKVNTVDFY